MHDGESSQQSPRRGGLKQIQILCALAFPFLIVSLFYEPVVRWMKSLTGFKSPPTFLNSLGMTTFATAKHAPVNAIYYLCALQLALATPHIFYYFVWTNPRGFMRLVRERLGIRAVPPYKVFARAAHAIKLFQLASLLAYLHAIGFISRPEFALREILAALNPYKLLLALELIAFGQLLNAAVYARIGESGVYYGVRLEGPRVPWCHSFPFDLLSHAQYTGAVLTEWGLLALLTTEYTTTYAFPQVTALTVFCFYAFSSYAEERL